MIIFHIQGCSWGRWPWWYDWSSAHFLYVCYVGFAIAYIHPFIHTSYFTDFQHKGDMPRNNQTIQSCKLLTQHTQLCHALSHSKWGSFMVHSQCLHLHFMGSNTDFFCVTFFLVSRSLWLWNGSPHCKAVWSNCQCNSWGISVSTSKQYMDRWSLLTLALQSVESCLWYWFRRICFMHLILVVTINLTFFIDPLVFLLFIGKWPVQK